MSLRFAITIAAVGKLGRGPEADLAARYTKRLPWSCSIAELPESRAGSADRRKVEEAVRLLKAVDGCDRVLALDERGADHSSEEWQTRLQGYAEDGAGRLGWIIGGPDGLDPDLLDRVDAVLCFGRATWPHKLVRVMLLEQLYRQWTLATGHPYHRA